MWICLFIFVFLKMFLPYILNFNYSCYTFKPAEFYLSIFSFIIIIIKCLVTSGNTPFLAYIIWHCYSPTRTSLIVQWVKNLPAMQETLVGFWAGKIRWRRDRLPTSVFLDFPCGSAGRESACNAGDLGSIPGFGGAPGEGNSYTPVFLPGKFYGQPTLSPSLQDPGNFWLLALPFPKCDTVKIIQCVIFSDWLL